jgi:hypothetical protein
LENLSPGAALCKFHEGIRDVEEKTLTFKNPTVAGHGGMHL